MGLGRFAFFDKDETQSFDGWGKLRSSKLAFPMMELEVLEFCQVELLARVWLENAGADYNSLDRERAWVILIAAHYAMICAEQSREIKTKRKSERVPEAFSCILRMGIPYDSFSRISSELREFMFSEEATNMKGLLKTKCGLSEFEARTRILAAYTASFIPKADDKVQSALYQFFLAARDDYFTAS